MHIEELKLNAVLAVTFLSLYCEIDLFSYSHPVGDFRHHIGYRPCILKRPLIQYLMVTKIFSRDENKKKKKIEINSQTSTSRN